MSVISILILVSHLQVEPPRSLPSGFPTKIFYAFIIPYACYMPKTQALGTQPLRLQSQQT